MKPFIVTRLIHAPLQLVFNTVADVHEFAKILPHVLSVEFLTEKQTGLGARFKETRAMGKQNHVTELEVVEYEEGRRIRMLNDAADAAWDTVYTVTQQEEATQLDVVMECRPRKFMAKLFIPLFWKKINSAFQADFDLVKADLEAR